MNLKKIASVSLVVAIVAVSITMWATSDSRYKDKLSTYEAKITEYEAKIAEDATKIAELEKSKADLGFQLELRNYVATFDGGHVTAAEALDRFNYVEYMYQSYGYSIEGYEDAVKQDIMENLVKDAIVQYEAGQLGLAEPDDAQKAELTAAAQASLDEYVGYYRANYEGEGKTEEAVVADTTAFLEQNGVTLDALYQGQLKTFAQKELFAQVVKDVAVTGDDVKLHYDTLVADDQTAYSAGDGYSYEAARTNGTAIYWNPEGYRTVKHVLVAFDDAQAARYTDITGRISALEKELAALTAPTATPAVTAEATAEPTTEATATAAASTATAEPTPTAVPTATAEPTPTAVPTAAPRTAEAINADLAAARAELDALYLELAPTAAEVVDQFNAGTDIDTLIANYGADPGMTSEPGKTNGYVVSAGTGYWEAAFTQGAMAIPAVGQISEPVRASNGLHVIYYLGDITPGAVDYESVKETLSSELLGARQNEAYDARIGAWMTELNVQYYVENFK